MVQNLCDDRMAPRLRGVAGQALRLCAQARGQSLFVRQCRDPVGGPRRPHGPAGRRASHGRRIRSPPPRRGGRTEPAARRFMRDAEGRLLRVSQCRRHRMEGEGAGVGAAGGHRRRGDRRSRFRNSRRGLSPPVLRQLHREHRARARPHGRIPQHPQGGLTMPTHWRGWPAGATAIALSVLALGSAPLSAQVYGAWRMPTAERDPGSQERSIETSAIDDAGTTFGLACRLDLSLYAFAVRSDRLARLAPAEDTTIALRVADEEPVRFTATARASGTVIVQQTTHQTAFAAIYAMLKQAGAATVAVSVADQSWVFALDGFNDATPELARRCGFDPDDPRPGARGAGSPGGPKGRQPPRPELPRPAPPPAR